MSSIPDVSVLLDGAQNLPNIDNLLGVSLVCMVIAAYLYGMSSSQAYIYYDRFPKDPWSYKSLVAGIWLLDTFHTALMAHTVYYYTVTHFGDYSVLSSKTVFSFNIEVLVVPIIALLVQGFFAYRALMQDRTNLPLSIAIGFFALVQLGFGFACGILAFTRLQGFPDLPKYSYLLICWLATGAAADLLVTVSLVWTFYRNKTTFSEEDGIMTKILMYSVHTGLVTTFTTLLDLVLIVASPHTLIFSGLNYILVKLYGNTIFYALNSRPTVDSRYQSNKSSNGSRSGDRATGVAKPVMPSFTVNQHSLSAPRVIARDPYAPRDMDDDDNSDKRRSLTEDEERHAGGKVTFRPDQASEVSYITMDKDPRGGLRRGDSDF